MGGDCQSQGKKYVLVLSIGGEPNRELRRKEGVYTSPVDNWFVRGLNYLTSREEMRNQFIKSLCDGSPKWNLLIPTATTENLIALYLLLLANEMNVVVPPSDQLLKDAFNEFIKIGNELNFNWIPEEKEQFKDAEAKNQIVKLISKWLGGR